jgi:NAD(P)-dependent dehydrogenase (short-subunit alcohol dehydrogenase family)
MMQRVAIITGAGRGIGRAAAVELASRGYRLALVARTVRDLCETSETAGTDVLICAGDVTDPATAENAVSQSLEKFGRIDALVNSAGVAPVLGIEQTTPREWRRIIDTNLSATFYFMRACWAPMAKQGGGAIVNLSSFSSRDPFPGFVAYGAAKAGVNLIGLAASREGEASGIRVYTIAPAAVETGMFRSIMTAEQFSPDRTLDPAEVAQAIAQCITGDLRHTSGEVIYLHKSRSLETL